MSVSEEVGIKLSLKGNEAFKRGLTEDAAAMHKISAAAAATDKATSGLAKGGMNLLGKGLGAVERAAKYAGVAVGGALVAAVGIGVKQANAMQTAMAQTNAVLASTGGAARVTSAHVLSLAKSVQNYSGIQDTTVQGAENLLLGFSNIRNGIGPTNQMFDRATAAAADLSVRLGTSIPAAALTLGKALQEPVKGMTQLRRAGIVLSQQQQNQIKAFVASGHLLDAQKVILAQVEKQAGGAAKAYGQTIPGAFARFKAAGRDALGQIVTDGEKFLNLAFAKKIGGAADGFTKLTQTVPKYLAATESRFLAVQHGVLGKIQSPHDIAYAIDYVLGAKGKLTPTLTKVISTVEDMWHTFQNVWPTIKDIATIVGGALLIGLTLVSGAFHVLADHGELARGVLVGVVAAFVALEALSGVAGVINGVSKAWKDLSAAGSAIKGLFGAAKTGEDTAAAGSLGGAAAALTASSGALDTSAAELTAAAFRLSGFDVGNRALGPILPAAEGAGGTAATAAGLGAGAVGLALAGAVGAVTGTIGLANDARKGDLGAIAGLLVGAPAIATKGASMIGDAITGAFGLKHPKGFLPHFPKLHSGGTVTHPGVVNMHPSEELIVLPAAASVVPLAPGGGQVPFSATSNPAGDLHVHVMVDKKELGTAVIEHFRWAAARGPR